MRGEEGACPKVHREVTRAVESAGRGHSRMPLSPPPPLSVVFPLEPPQACVWL
jgi:hypothetical protein